MHAQQTKTALALASRNGAHWIPSYIAFSLVSAGEESILIVDLPGAVYFSVGSIFGVFQTRRQRREAKANYQ